MHVYMFIKKKGLIMYGSNLSEIWYGNKWLELCEVKGVVTSDWICQPCCCQQSMIKARWYFNSKSVLAAQCQIFVYWQLFVLSSPSLVTNARSPMSVPSETFPSCRARWECLGEWLGSAAAAPAELDARGSWAAPVCEGLGEESGHA